MAVKRKQVHIVKATYRERVIEEGIGVSRLDSGRYRRVNCHTKSTFKRVHVCFLPPYSTHFLYALDFLVFNSLKTIHPFLITKYLCGELSCLNPRLQARRILFKYSNCEDEEKNNKAWFSKDWFVFDREKVLQNL